MVKKFGRQIPPGRLCPHAAAAVDRNPLGRVLFNLDGAAANELFGATVMSSDLCFLGYRRTRLSASFFMYPLPLWISSAQRVSGILPIRTFCCLSLLCTTLDNS